MQQSASYYYPTPHQQAFQIQSIDLQEQRQDPRRDITFQHPQQQPQQQQQRHRRAIEIPSRRRRSTETAMRPISREAGIGGFSHAYRQSGIGNNVQDERDSGIGKLVFEERDSEIKKSMSFTNFPRRESSQGMVAHSVMSQDARVREMESVGGRGESFGSCHEPECTHSEREHHFLKRLRHIL
ncbi:hypothetical protein GGI22_000041 [Coemansia erecta]|nr:hypothetical protein GGI22_000041 [Coemansia erecta]